MEKATIELSGMIQKLIVTGIIALIGGVILQGTLGAVQTQQINQIAGSLKSIEEKVERLEIQKGSGDTFIKLLSKSVEENKECLKEHIKDGH